MQAVVAVGDEGGVEGGAAGQHPREGGAETHHGEAGVDAGVVFVVCRHHLQEGETVGDWEEETEGEREGMSEERT